MPDAQFESYNNLNQLQFSSTFQNYGMLSKGTYNLTKELWGWTDGLTTGKWKEANSSGVPVSGAPDLPTLYATHYLEEFSGGILGEIVAFCSTSPIVATATVYPNPGFDDIIQWRIISSVYNASVEVFVFEKMEKLIAFLPSNGAGLELYDSNSKLTYSSELKPIRFVSSHSIGTSGGSLGVTVPGGRKYAVSVAANAILQTINNGGVSVQTFPRIIFPTFVEPRIYPRPNGTFTGAYFSGAGGTGTITLGTLAGAGFTHGTVSTGRLDVFDVTGY